MDCDRKFPTVVWDGVQVTFRPVPIPADGTPPFAVVVFARRAGGLVLADIRERGWITPSGRIEPGETPLDAAIRETREEIGGELKNPVEIGHYELRQQDGAVLTASAFVGEVNSFGEIPAGSESRGARLVSMEEVPEVYWRWDDLLDAMFAYAVAYPGPTEAHSSPAHETSGACPPE